MPRLPEEPAPHQLSLFEGAVPPGPDRAPVPGAPPRRRSGDGEGSRARSPRRPEPSPEAASPAAPTLPPVSYLHAHATHRIALAGCEVGYQLRRARRRTIGFQVSVDGLSVSAPRWVGIGDIEGALRGKGDWILRKLAEQRDRRRRLDAAQVDWRDGASFPFLGQTAIVVIDPRVAGAVLHTDADTLPGVPRLTLHVGLPHGASTDQVRDAVQSWLQRQARRVFEERCQLYASRLGVRMRRLRLSSAQTRWGSASADGSIRLNWRLVHFAMPVIDYVVAHELAHLREMNHSPAFWDVVRSVIPDLEQRRAQLRDPALPSFD